MPTRLRSALHYGLLFPACLALFLASCATPMSSGIDGFESAVLPPYRSSGARQSELALAAQAGASAKFSPALPFILGAGLSGFAQGEGVLQWHPRPGARGFCGALSSGAWIAYSWSPRGEDDAGWSPAGRALSYGYGAALRLGFVIDGGAEPIYAPAAQFRYSYEDGPYFDMRRSMSSLPITLPFPLAYLNLKESRHAWIASISPLDLNWNLDIGDFRFAADIGWNDRWYPFVAWSFSDGENGSAAASLLPTNYEVKISYRFPGSGWFLGTNIALAVDEVILPTPGMVLCVGYCW